MNQCLAGSLVSIVRPEGRFVTFLIYLLCVIWLSVKLQSLDENILKIGVHR